MKFYLAYGMNTNLGSMMNRSPRSTSLGKVILKDHAFKFKHHADAEYSPGASMECAIWAITEECERSLDNLEGYPYYYEKKMVPVEFQGKIVEAMIYYMVSDYKTPSRPSQSYYDMVIQGYHQHGMNTSVLHRAYESTIDLDLIDISAYN